MYKLLYAFTLFSVSKTDNHVRGIKLNGRLFLSIFVILHNKHQTWSKNNVISHTCQSYNNLNEHY